MTHTITIPSLKLTTGTLAGDVFYGSFETTIKNKLHTVLVSNHLNDIDKKYNFRIAAKCKAGFINISDWGGHPLSVISYWKKNVLANIQVEVVYPNGAKQWFNVFTTKNNKWHSIDLGFLKVITVATMRQSFPEMCDMKLWELVGAKTWADKAFTK